jgi:methionyl-tRNA synthetase
MNLAEDNFNNVKTSIKNHEIQSFKPLIQRVEDEKIENLIEASKSG